MNEQDERHLRRAIELASAAREAGDQPYGAVLVGGTGEVLVEDRNTVISDGDIAGHPELKLARWAGKELDIQAARHATLYTSCEPCTMCKNAIARAGIGRVLFALSSQQLHELKPPGAVAPDSAHVELEGPALFDEARIPINGYYT